MSECAYDLCWDALTVAGSSFCAVHGSALDAAGYIVSGGLSNGHRQAGTGSASGAGTQSPALSAALSATARARAVYDAQWSTPAIEGAGAGLEELAEVSLRGWRVVKLDQVRFTEDGPVLSANGVRGHGQTTALSEIADCTDGGLIISTAHYVDLDGKVAPPIPSAACTCGYYAAKQVSALDYEGDALVWCAAVGLTVEHEHGWRSERIQILALFPMPVRTHAYLLPVDVDRHDAADRDHRRKFFARQILVPFVPDSESAVEEWLHALDTGTTIEEYRGIGRPFVDATTASNFIPQWTTVTRVNGKLVGA